MPYYRFSSVYHMPYIRPYTLPRHPPWPASIVWWYSPCRLARAVAPQSRWDSVSQITAFIVGRDESDLLNIYAIKIVPRALDDVHCPALLLLGRYQEFPVVVKSDPISGHAILEFLVSLGLFLLLPECIHIRPLRTQPKKPSNDLPAYLFHHSALYALVNPWNAITVVFRSVPGIEALYHPLSSS